PETVTYQQLLPELEALSLTYAEQAIAALGDLPATFTTAELAQAWGIVPEQRSLFEYLLEMAGKIQNSKFKIPFGKPLRRLQNSKPINPLSNSEFRIPNSEFAQAELSLLTRCGENLVAVLRGEVDPIGLLFPQGDLSELTQLYESSPGARVMNALVQSVVTATLAQQSCPVR
ncbi:MAG: hypothetical protein AAFY20_27750, partial [Cyanobacteria bacterium J06639_14]